MPELNEFTESFKKFMSGYDLPQPHVDLSIRRKPKTQMLNEKTSKVITVIVLGDDAEFEIITSYNRQTHCIDLAASYCGPESDNRPIVLIGATFAGVEDGKDQLLDLTEALAMSCADDINTAFSEAISPYLEFLKIVRLCEVTIPSPVPGKIRSLSGVFILPKE